MGAWPSAVRAEPARRAGRGVPAHRTDGVSPRQQVLAIQRAAGNRAVANLLARPGGRLQRCGTTPPDECPCHDDGGGRAAVARAIGPGAAPASPRGRRAVGPRVSRQPTGEGHDLGSALLHGDQALEEVKEGSRVLRVGAGGPEVRLVQEGLARVGHPPVGGPTGSYDSRTAAAVRSFQAASGLGLMDQDGRVGKRTITLLDGALRHGSTTPDPDAEADDDAIVEKYTRSADKEDRVFFPLSGTVLDDAERAKVAAYAATHADEELWLTGLASEEGPEAGNARLAADRVHAVDAALQGAGHQGTRNPDPAPEQGKGSSRYRFMRAVQLSTRQPVSPQSCAGQPRSEPCRPEPAAKIASANARAETILVTALEALANPDRSGDMAARADDLLRALYNTTDADHADTRRKVALQVLDVLDVIRDPAKFVCGTECDPVCLGGASAVETGGEITVCAQGLDDEDEATRPALMIHEAHHAGVADSSDLAYNYSRLLRHLTPDAALKNASSFHGLVVNTVQPSGMPLTTDLTRITPVANDTYQVPDPDHEGPRLEKVLGWMAEWIGTTDFTTAGVHRHASEARRTGRYASQGAAFHMGFLAPRFEFDRRPAPDCWEHLATCPVPTEGDLRLLAAINDRVDLMENTIDDDLTIVHRPGGATQWQRDGSTPGAVVEVSDHFLAADDNVRASILMDALVAATPGISARFAVEYTAWIQHVRQNRDRIGPESPQP